MDVPGCKLNTGHVPSGKMYLLVYIAFGVVHLINAADLSMMELDINVEPPDTDIVLVGSQSKIAFTCKTLAHDICIRAQLVQGNGVLKIISDEVYLYATNGTSNPKLPPIRKLPGTFPPIRNTFFIRVLGLRPGRGHLKFMVLHAKNRTTWGPLKKDYEVSVVERVNILRDAFLYLLLTMQVLTLLMLALRLRGAAVREVLCRPCAILAGVITQAVFMPLVTLGLSLALALPVHSVVCLLLLGCCPTGVMSPVFAVLQQGHVELAVVLSLLQTTTAFGVMPLWLFTYGNFLGLTYDHVSRPYFYIAGALCVLGGPLVVGLATQRCTPRALPRMDRAIPPTCALLVLIAFTVSAVGFWTSWTLVTWRLVLASALIPASGMLLGAIATATFRQRLPQVKTVAIVTGVQHTLLARVIVQMSYPTADASLMAVTLVCADFSTLCLMVLLYLPHVALWLGWERYRPLHDHTGIGGLYHSISDQIVRSMIKAGEITFGRRLCSSPKLKEAAVGPAGQFPKPSLGFNVAQLYSASIDSLAQNQLIPPSSPTSMAYIMGTSSNEQSPASKKSEKDSLSGIDYDMLKVGKSSPTQLKTCRQDEPRNLSKATETEDKDNQELDSELCFIHVNMDGISVGISSTEIYDERKDSEIPGNNVDNRQSILKTNGSTSSAGKVPGCPDSGVPRVRYPGDCPRRQRHISAKVRDQSPPPPMMYSSEPTLELLSAIEEECSMDLNSTKGSMGIGLNGSTDMQLKGSMSFGSGPVDASTSRDSSGRGTMIGSECSHNTSYEDPEFVKRS